MDKKVLIIGSGLGGLTAALRLAVKGFDVQIVEQYKQAGGRLNQLKSKGYTFDMAPTFFSMSYEFKEFIADCKCSMPFKFVELNPLYHVHFAENNHKYVIYKDLERLAEQFRAIEPDFYEKIQQYLRKTGQLFKDTENKIIHRNFNSAFDFVFQMFKVPPKHAPLVLQSYWKYLGKYFNHDETKIILSLVSFFLGATPFDTKAVYTLLNYTELVHDGYYNVKGGMYAIVEGLLDLLKEKKINITYNTKIVDIEVKDNKIIGFIDQHNQKWQADLYVVNADAAWFRGKILKRKKFAEPSLANMKWTLAPFTIYLGVNKKIESLAHHNYFLRLNFKEYSEKIFKNQINLENPYYYVNVNSRLNPECAPPGCESLFILIPAPDLRYKPDWSDAEHLADCVIEDLSQRCGVNIKENIETRVVLHPGDWERMFQLYKGSGLGLAHDLNQIGGFRPKNFDEEFTNLFYVGSSTVPGTGLPMAVISSKLTTERIIKKYAGV